jgi:very-short-patch-repair endonuclease
MPKGKPTHKPWYLCCQDCGGKKNRSHGMFCPSCAKRGARNPMYQKEVTDKTRELLSISQIGKPKPKPPGFGEILSKALKGKKYPNTKRRRGRPYPTKEQLDYLHNVELLTYKEIGKLLDWSTPSIRNFAEDLGIVHGPEFQAQHNKRVSKAKKGKSNSPEACLRIAKTVSDLWKDPEYAARQRAGRELSPNKLESSFIEMCRENNWPFEYVGDWKITIDGKCPDFMDKNRNLIELFGDFWHRGQNPEDRIHFFRERGYRCLVLWENEVKNNKESVISKVNKFLGENQCLQSISA